MLVANTRRQQTAVAILRADHTTMNHEQRRGMVVMVGAVAAETVLMVADTLAAAAAGQLLLNPSSTEGADHSSDHRHQFIVGSWCV